jgi:transcriptional regulator with XRE-family HTH domain
MKRKHAKLSDQIRQAIDGCGVTRYQISQDTGIDAATLCRFMRGNGGLSIPVLDTLSEYLGLRIVSDKPQAKKGT